MEGFKRIALWVIAILVGMFSLAAATSGQPIAAFLFLGSAFLVAPRGWKLVQEKTGFARRGLAASALAFSAVLVGVLIERASPFEERGAIARQGDGEASNGEASGHEQVVEKAKASIEQVSDYDRAGFRATYDRVGSSKFSKLSEHERGAIYAVAESSGCDAVKTSGVSDRSTREAILFFVDCQNEQRFIVGEKQAGEAGKRFEDGELASRDLAASCAVSNPGYCHLSEGQKRLLEDEAKLATICDEIVKKALVSRPDMDWSFEAGYGDDNTVIVKRGFTSQNGFGAELNNRYQCVFDGESETIKDLKIVTPYGTEDII